MTAELVRGQNHPLSQSRLEIRVSAGAPVVAAAALGDENGRIHGVEWVAHPGAPTRPGLEVSRQAAADHRLAVDLDAMTEAVHRVSVLLALPAPGSGPGPARFGAVAAPFVAVTGLDGSEIAGYTITGLETESAVVALELYRRQGAWKVRAVGQGYAGGLADLLTDQGLPEAVQLAGAVDEAVTRGLARSVQAPPSRPADGDRSRQPAAPAVGPEQGGTAPQGAPGSVPPSYGGQPAGGPGQAGPQSAYGGTGAADPSATAGGPIDYSHPGRRNSAPPPPPTAPPAPPGQPARPVAGDATGWSMEERLYNQVWGMFEDLARTAAAYRSAVDFAESRMDKELEQALSDPRSRIGGQSDAVREAARARHAQLVGQAREVLDRDLAQLAAEADVVEPALPPGLRPLGQPRLARLPGADGDTHGAASGRSAAAGGRPDPHPDAAPAAAGARPVDRQRTGRLGRRVVHRLPRHAAPRHGDGGGARGATARRVPGGRVHRARHRPGRIGRAAAGTADADRCAGGSARPGRRGRGGGAGPAHTAGRPGADGAARRRPGRAAARLRHLPAAADRQ
ncbi:hypothetical protein GCM10023238_16000 [Streptomyces heliomycini]